MNVRAIWAFVAGDAKSSPLGVAAAVVLATLLVRTLPAAGPWIGAVYTAVIAAGLTASIFERT